MYGNGKQSRYGVRARLITSDMDLVDQNLYQIPFGDLGGGNQGTPPMTIGETYAGLLTIPVHFISVTPLIFNATGKLFKFLKT